ncbi:MAG: mobilization protein [Gammaproteobacteria bacterium]|nr:mobilization protein [Gammaproteobacteria bacterium]
MVNSMKERLEKLKQQKDALTARIQKIESRAQAKERKLDTRKKILVGSYYLNEAAKNNSMAELKQLMDQYLTRNSDRALFDLPELKKQ